MFLSDEIVNITKENISSKEMSKKIIELCLSKFKNPQVPCISDRENALLLKSICNSYNQAVKQLPQDDNVILSKDGFRDFLFEVLPELKTHLESINVII